MKLNFKFWLGCALLFLMVIIIGYNTTMASGFKRVGKLQEEWRATRGLDADYCATFQMDFTQYEKLIKKYEFRKYPTDYLQVQSWSDLARHKLNPPARPEYCIGNLNKRTIVMWRYGICYFDSSI